MPPLDDFSMDEEIALACKALAHPMRVRILRFLGEREAYCGDLVDVLGLAQSTISHHLRILREAHLIEGREEGAATCYRLNKQQCQRVCVELQAVIGSLTLRRR